MSNTRRFYLLPLWLPKTESCLLAFQPLTAKNENFCFFNNFVMHVTISPFSALAAKVLKLLTLFTINGVKHTISPSGF